MGSYAASNFMYKYHILRPRESVDVGRRRGKSRSWVTPWVLVYNFQLSAQLMIQCTTYDSAYNLWFSAVPCRDWYWFCVNFCFGVQLLFRRATWVLAHNLGFGVQLTTQNTPTLLIAISLSSVKRQRSLDMCEHHELMWAKRANKCLLQQNHACRFQRSQRSQIENLQKECQGCILNNK